MAEGDTNLNLTDLLEKAKVNENEYIAALEVLSTRDVVVLKLQSVSDANMAS